MQSIILKLESLYLYIINLLYARVRVYDFVIPAKTGISAGEIPAFVGMTNINAGLTVKLCFINSRRSRI